MKKVMTLLVTLCLLFALCACGGKTPEASAEPSVMADIAIFNAGENVLMSFGKLVTDADGDGIINICDALAVAHRDAGQPEGFDAPKTEYGRSIAKLWGVADSAYGCCINNEMAMDLTAPIKDGDYIAAYVYTDIETWSDSYCFFDKLKAEAAAGENVLLQVSYIGYDENWNAVTQPLCVTGVTVDGQDVDFFASEGKIMFAAPGKGTHLISAKNDNMILVPPVCELNVK